MNINYPATADQIQKFIVDKGPRYISALNALRSVIKKGIEEEPSLKGVYKFYSRGDRQGNDELKHRNKIRTKFNNYCLKHGLITSNIFDMPDIVGVTIAVVYPSDINAVCLFIDKKCDEKKFYSLFHNDSENVEANKDNVIKIETKHGVVRRDHDYYACHYYIRMIDGQFEPIVEIQIKTVVYDAWGLKTHDLTYKDHVQIDDDVRKNFLILGRTLSNIDMQSDLLQSAVRKSYVYRENIKRKIRLQLSSYKVRGFAENYNGKTPGGLQHPKHYSSVIDNIIEKNCAYSADDVGRLRNAAFQFCEKDSDWLGCAMLCVLAVITNEAIIKDDVFHYTSIWQSKDPQNISARSLMHIAKYYFISTDEAIKEAKDVLDWVEARRDSVGALSAEDAKGRYYLLGSLAYYFAEIIGTHEGREEKADENALLFRDQTKPMFGSIIGSVNLSIDVGKEWVKLIDDVLDACDALDQEAAGVADSLGHIFNIVDNSIFVEIQTATDSESAKRALGWLDRMKGLQPKGLLSTALLTHELHAHYARKRLLELQAEEALRGLV